jgi:hypothetical protein
MGLAPPAIHNFLIYTGEVIDFRLVEVFMYLGLLFLMALKLNKLKIERIYILYVGLAFLQLTFFAINYSFIKWFETIYSTTLPIIVLMYGGFKINFRDVKIIYKIITLIVWLNVFFAIFVSNFYAGYEGQHLIFSNIGGGIPTAWMLFFWLVTYDYIDSHKDGVTSLVFCAVTLAIVLLDSRSVLAALFVYIFISMHRRKTYLIGFGLIISSIVVILFFGELLGRISNVDFSDNSAQLRFNAILATASIVEHSYVMGSEVGGHFPRIDKNISEELITESGNAAKFIGGYILPTEPHNSYMLYGVEYGLIGLLIVAYINIKNSFVRNKFDVNILMALFVMFATSSVLKFDIKLLFMVVVLLLLCKAEKRV